jgi:hypothetical protein
MKYAVGLIAFIWLMCGLAAASWLHDHSLKTIAWGPVSLAEAYNDNPVSYPAPN